MINSGGALMQNAIFHFSDTEKCAQPLTEETSGNKVCIDFEILDLDWIRTQEKTTYHGWPTLVNTGNDRLVAVCSGERTAHIDPYGKVVMYESCDGGKNWSAPRILADGPLDDRDAGIVVTPAGTWLVNYFTSLAFASMNPPDRTPPAWKEIEDRISVTTIKEELGFFMMRSTDQGKTWSRKYPIGVNNVHGPIVLSDGTLFYCGKGFAQRIGQASFGDIFVSMRSTDDGMTWETISSYRNGDSGTYDLSKWHEFHSIQTGDGTILTQIRLEHNSTWQMESKDGGKTWQDFHYVCGGFPSHLLKLSDGRLLMSYGYRKENYGNRCRISSDNGKTWSEPLILTGNSPSYDLGYPSTAELSDGTLVTLWYEYDPAVSAALLRYARWKLK